MGFHMIKLQVLENLQLLFPGVYVWDNVILSGTHTHSTPGGTGGTALVDITTLGFIKHNFQAAVDGIVQAIVQATGSIQPGSIRIAEGELDKANINRSPASYLNDPQAERDQYADNTDHLMTLLRFDADDGTEIGMVNWFPVHCVSMNNTNTLVSGDNKGLASQLFETAKSPKNTLPGKGKFIAAFAQANEGDVSPNTNGPKCPDGTPCDFVTSTCNGQSEGCIASGPGKDMYESTEIIAGMQNDKAAELYAGATTKLIGPVKFVHQFVDMQAVQIQPEFSTTHQAATTCQAAMGYAFAGGTTDGPGDFDFHQGTNSTNPFWAFISSFLAKPTPEQVACQAPKPILLDVGLVKPIEWVPYILPMQLVRVGNLYICAVPAELTTMSGRRLKQTVLDSLAKLGQLTADTRVVIAGLSNSYSHYVATYEEYQIQRYEGASTLYGPHTLDAYRQQFAALTAALATGQALPPGPTPEDMRNHTFSFQPGVVTDLAPVGFHYGSLVAGADVKPSYARGALVSAVFWGASPRNNVQAGKSFMYVQQQQADGSFLNVASDANWETKYTWARVGLAYSQVKLTWDTTKAEPGTYRMQTFGMSKDLIGDLTPYAGQTSTFVLV